MHQGLVYSHYRTNSKRLRVNKGDIVTHNVDLTSV